MPAPGAVISLLVEKSSLQHVRKFPAPLHREIVRKPLNLAGHWAPKSLQRAGFREIPGIMAQTVEAS